MEKATDRQVKKIKELCEEYQVTCEDIENISKQDAWNWIHDVLNGNSEDKDKPKVEVNSVKYGMIFKLVYRRWIRNHLHPLDQKDNFMKEVKETYFLLEFK